MSQSSSKYRKRTYRSLGQMNADRDARRHGEIKRLAPSYVPVSTPTPKVLVLSDAQREVILAERAKKSAEEKAARDARVKLEEEAALKKRLAAMPAKNRKAFLEEQAVLAKARTAVKMLKAETVEADVDLSLFGIEVE